MVRRQSCIYSQSLLHRLFHWKSFMITDQESVGIYYGIYVKSIQECVLINYFTFVYYISLHFMY